MALDACSTLPQLAGYSERSVAMQAAMNMRQVEMGEPLGKRVARLERVCADVVPTDATESFRWQQQAAQAGNRESLFRAAATPALRLEDLLAHVPEWSAWRDRALGYLEQSLVQGDARAVDALAMAYREGPFLRRPRIVAADAQRGYLYSRLRTRIAEAAGEPPARIAAMVAEEASWSLDDAGRAVAESEAARLFDQYFAGRPAQPLDADVFTQDDFGACER